MKYKLFGIGALALVLVCALLASAVEAEEGPYRYHQHREARGPDAGCDCDGTELCTHLPLVIIDTGGVEIPGKPIVDENNHEVGVTTTEEDETMLHARISVMSRDDQNHHPSDQPDLESELLIRIREIGRASCRERV